MHTAAPLGKTTTELPPCAVRLDPLDPQISFFGTYSLNKATGTRHGSIDIYKDLVLERTVPTAAAVLDLKFSPADPQLLVLAHLTGNIGVWRWKDGNLDKISEIQATEESVLVTLVFFNPHNPKQLLATFTDGYSGLVDLDSGHVTFSDHVHDLECWTGNFGEAGPAQNVVFTGGDDGKLIAHDSRTMEKIWATSYRHHDAGVVSVLCAGPNWLSDRPNEIWTGLYDDCLRVFDLRHIEGDHGPQLFQSLLPAELHKVNLGGGVWRLIPAPKGSRADHDSVLTCCMYDGARIILPEDGKPVVQTYFKGDHESMCYGGDWGADDSIVTCLFYDNVVHKWLP